MEISAEKTKLMTTSVASTQEIKVHGQKLETVTSFKYLGSVITFYEGSKPEIHSRIVQTTKETRLKPVWNDSIFFQFQDMTDALPYPSSCMLVNHRPSQQSCKEKYEPWK